MKLIALTLAVLTFSLTNTTHAGEACKNADGSLTPKCDQMVNTTCALPNSTLVTACKNQFMSTCVNKDGTFVSSCKAKPPAKTSGYSESGAVYFEASVGNK